MHNRSGLTIQNPCKKKKPKWRFISKYYLLQPINMCNLQSIVHKYLDYCAVNIIQKIYGNWSRLSGRPVNWIAVTFLWLPGTWKAKRSSKAATSGLCRCGSGCWGEFPLWAKTKTARNSTKSHGHRAFVLHSAYRFWPNPSDLTTRRSPRKDYIV